MQNPIYMQQAPTTVVVIEQPSANLMDRSNYAGDATLSRGIADCTCCGRQALPNSDEKFTVCCMYKGIDGCCFEQEHPDLVIKAMDIGEISPMPTQDETTTCCYCCCSEYACIMPNHDLCINDDQCCKSINRSECNIGEAEACYKITCTYKKCDFQRNDHCIGKHNTGRLDLLCCCQYKYEEGDFGEHCTCCKGQSKCLCCVRKFAFPTDDDVPCGIGCCGIMCCGGQAKQKEPEAGNGNVVVVVNK
jgi:hypothetical protein